MVLTKLYLMPKEEEVVVQPTDNPTEPGLPHPPTVPIKPGA